MVEPINLNKFRKAKARAEKEQRAQQNRIKFGRTKAEKTQDHLNKTRDQSDHDGKKRE
ncbi:MAG: DUF4169 family protein [Pseudomonadota bacterium]